MRIKLHTTDTVTFVKRAYKLAYDACGGTSGMGFFQARDRVSEDDVFGNVCTSGDYPFDRTRAEAEKRALELDFYGDYVFGRMMKLGVKIKDGVVVIRDGWTPDYQAFSRKYPTAVDLTKAALLSLGDREDAFTILEEEKR